MQPNQNKSLSYHNTLERRIDQVLTTLNSNVWRKYYSKSWTSRQAAATGLVLFESSFYQKANKSQVYTVFFQIIEIDKRIIVSLALEIL